MMASFMGLIFTGFPIAWVLGGLAAIFTAFAIIFEVDFNIVTNVDWYYTSMSVDRVWDVMENWVMVALPMFIFMGILLDRSGLAKDLLTGFSRLLGGVKGGLAITVTLIGVLLAASTGIIGASVVLLGLLGLLGGLGLLGLLGGLLGRLARTEVVQQLLVELEDQGFATAGQMGKLSEQGRVSTSTPLRC